jgi:hypothetical protein
LSTEPTPLSPSRRCAATPHAGSGHLVLTSWSLPPQSPQHAQGAGCPSCLYTIGRVVSRVSSRNPSLAVTSPRRFAPSLSSPSIYRAPQNSSAFSPLTNASGESPQSTYLPRCRPSSAVNRDVSSAHRRPLRAHEHDQRELVLPYLSSPLLR